MQRNTRQRKVIQDIFTGNKNPLNHKEVLKLAKKNMNGMGIATVYRAINSLLKEGWLIPVNTPNMGTLYERAGKSHHHHFFCRKCLKLLELGTCPLAGKSIVPKGFKAESHEIFVQGLCNSCSTT